MLLDDTIAAIATPLGEGALAVVRLSGKNAFAIADHIFVPGGKTYSKISSAPTHTSQYGHVAQNGRTIDEVLAAVMRAPRTFTREDVVEFTLVAFGPEMIAARGIEKLDGYPHPVADLAHAAFGNVPDA